MDQNSSDPGSPEVNSSMLAPKPPAERLAPPPPSQVATPARANYLIRHWRGELALGVSYWINTVIVNLLLAVITLATSDLAGRSNYGGLVALSLAWVAQCVVLPWQVGGVWRSAGRRRPDGSRSRSAGLARFVTVKGLTGFAISLAMDAVPSLWSALEQAR
jgi:hypothetical protein